METKKEIKKVFDEYFSNWKIELPEKNLNERLNGYLNKSRWVIQYCFGIENGMEYLDFYATHRATSDRHVRIYENGKTVKLPRMRAFYTDDSEEYNKKVMKLLNDKGFYKFTINMALQENANELTLDIAGSGTMIIDWGKGTPSEEHILTGFDFIDYRCGGCGWVYHLDEFTSICNTYGNIFECAWKVKCDKSKNSQICTKKFVNNYRFRGHSTSTVTIFGEKITHFRCSNNNLTYLDVSKSTELISLECYENQLTTIDLSKSTALEYLDCSINRLTNLDVSANRALMELFCKDNRLTYLDVSKNTALECLNCMNNQLTHLDVSANKELMYLHCGDNPLTYLDVSDNVELYELSYPDNLLTDVDLSNLKYFY